MIDFVKKPAQLQQQMAGTEVNNWQDISDFLDKLQDNSPAETAGSKTEFRAALRQGIAFITFDFGIDGVSIEIAKYAACLERIFADDQGILPLHFIGGDFYDKADIILKPEWNRFCIPEMNGWSKWFDGQWFAKLYYAEMPEGSQISDDMAREIWRQTQNFAGQLSSYLAEKDISLIIPVNYVTNPGNFAITLATTIVAEALGLYVISSNHDFYWEGGKPAAEKAPGEGPGPRDHFFKNMDNGPFFSLFKKIYPWNGRRWLQVNINTPQTEELVEKFGFDPGRVFELGTSISDEFFTPFDSAHSRNVRQRMAHILSDGQPVIHPVPVAEHINNLADWMNEQKPVACAISTGLALDPGTPKTIYCLQPTRIIARKRIEKDLQLLQALLQHEPFVRDFAADPDRQLVLHITGPVPIEHQHDLETVLNAYVELCHSVPKNIAERVFIAFSVGTEDHPSLGTPGLEPLCIEEIYRLATVIVFPSETEGRGLPIIEASAAGIPIICSRYYPEEVFAEVVGEELPEEQQIKYFLFPEQDFPPEFLDQVTALLLSPENFTDLKAHNKEAVKQRYSSKMIRQKFNHFIDLLQDL